MREVRERLDCLVTAPSPFRKRRLLVDPLIAAASRRHADYYSIRRWCAERSLRRSGLVAMEDLACPCGGYSYRCYVLP